MNRTFGQAQIKEQTGALVVAVRRGHTRQFIPNPPVLMELLPGDALVSLGSRKQLTALAVLINPDKPDKLIPAGMDAA